MTSEQRDERPEAEADPIEDLDVQDDAAAEVTGGSPTSIEQTKHEQAKGIINNIRV